MNGNGTGTLHQRLATIAGKVGAIKATGKTPQGVKALSIANVEDALRPLFIEHRVLTGFRWNDKPMPLERVSIKVNEKTGEIRESKYYEWLADLTVWMVNADDGTDRIEDRICDIGSSPSAAVSFSLKRYFRALFHLADEDDENRPGATRKPVQVARPAVKSSGVAIPPAPSPSRHEPALGQPAASDSSPAVLGASVTRATLMARLIDEQHMAGMTTESLRSLAQHLFQKTGANDLTDAELGLLIDEVRGVGLSTKEAVKA